MTPRQTLSFVALVLAVTLEAQPPKNAILMIGDGMGTAQVTAARHARGAEFQIGRMRTMGLVATHSADAAVTDSAAAATAFATGVKTNNGMVSVDPSGANLPTVGEAAHAAGKQTGFVTTTRFWDATPAAFFAHAKRRYVDAPSLARQILASGVDLGASGGLDLLGSKDLPTLDDIRKDGFAVVSNPAELQSIAAPRVIAIFPTQGNDLDTPGAPLPVLTKWAIDRLDDDPDGFFLVVEHEGVDGASHTNSSAQLREVMVSFDTAVGVALDFAASRGDTLVLVVGDHETGGLRITEGRELRKWRTEWSTMEHTGTAVPIFAFGPGAGDFAGVLDNTEVGRQLLALMGK